ncbi:ATP-dependent DNA helicase [Rhodospira trueperi]|uniref:ATP-dependent DNA helicase DinG n=1 Tax=Rhodospira trueperi TaxID=69960 RepID=A0A1G6XJK9_9PROT|nr:ATP-dependent DNA helicase [Rhodospira trueperi]SDD78379.1 ATP-dependent DNA helicase DinG [Rhodospira trueperi]
MTTDQTLPPSSSVSVPPVPALVASPRRAVLVHPDGEVEEGEPAVLGRRAADLRPLVCHAPGTAARLGRESLRAHDVLELFAFARPARFVLPTAAGLAEALGLERPEDLVSQALVLPRVAAALLHEVTALPGRERSDARSLAFAMARGGWMWGGPVLAALGAQGDAPHAASMVRAFRVWERLTEISEHAPDVPAGNHPVEGGEARARLADLLGPAAEDRPQQADYASAATAAFAPREKRAAPHMVLAEAGTGVGKTLGYIAPASVWADRNEGTVWISTFTRNLQRQLDGELGRLYPDPAEKNRRVVIRKGRENYLCLLNLEEAVSRLPTQPAAAIPLGLMARWALATRDGDLIGGDFPGWLVDILGRGWSVGLADRRGECIFSACPHFNRCMIEKAVRRARRARLVVANHALVLVQAALGGLEDGVLPTRYVFDEGHHLFDAADSAFSAHLSGAETAELRRWLLGAEDGSRTRARGLKARAEELIGESNRAAEALVEVLQGARVLPGPGWHARLGEGGGKGPTERFLSLVREQVLARARGQDGPYSLETEVTPPVPELAEAAAALDVALHGLDLPVSNLMKALEARLDDEASTLDPTTRQRIEGLVRSLDRRVLRPVRAWRAMCRTVGSETPPEFVDWLGIERAYGRDMDVGLHRHWIDPTVPFAEAVASRAHGLLVTSATLRDGSGDAEADWRAAERRTGAAHLPHGIRAAVPSPFDYPAQTRVLVVTDVRKDTLHRVAAAYRELFIAAGGGALGLFTAIGRLRAVHRHIAADMDAADLPLYAQHVDGIDPATLVDMFRAEENACLLGTDAMRDGVDVPGRSLRLIVFDRVPWPRPDILHKARRAHFGGRAYDDMMTRLRLKQAFGRLVRRADDRGAFVLLDPMMPSRLGGAFPDGVSIERVGLAEAVETVRGMM